MHNERHKNLDIRKEKIMPVLTNFLSVQELTEEEVALSESYISTIREYRSAIKHVNKAFDIHIWPKGKYEEFGTLLYEKEKATLVELFKSSGCIPEEFINSSCFGDPMPYNTIFGNLLRYPIVSVEQLKRLADTLSFVIIPINYVDIGKIFNMYIGIDSRDTRYSYRYDAVYADTIKRAFGEFCDTIKEGVGTNCINPQTIYILAPLSFYDAWLEVSSEQVFPKYFSSKLLSLSTTLGLLIPTQRNLYKIASSNSENIHEMKQTMDANFQMLKQSIEDCHRRINWVERMVSNLQSQVASLQVRLHEAELRTAELESMIYCLLDPIIFAVDSDVDISRSSSNSARARIGLCFGPEMPLDFFVEQGLTTIFDKRFDTVTEILQPKISIIETETGKKGKSKK